MYNSCTEKVTASSLPGFAMSAGLNADRAARKRGVRPHKIKALIAPAGPARHPVVDELRRQPACDRRYYVAGAQDPMNSYDPETEPAWVAETRAMKSRMCRSISAPGRP